MASDILNEGNDIVQDLNDAKDNSELDYNERRRKRAEETLARIAELRAKRAQESVAYEVTEAEISSPTEDTVPALEETDVPNEDTVSALEEAETPTKAQASDEEAPEIPQSELDRQSSVEATLARITELRERRAREAEMIARREQEARELASKAAEEAALPTPTSEAEVSTPEVVEASVLELTEPETASVAEVVVTASAEPAIAESAAIETVAEAEKAELDNTTLTEPVNVMAQSEPTALSDSNATDAKAQTEDKVSDNSLSYILKDDAQSTALDEATESVKRPMEPASTVSAEPVARYVAAPASAVQYAPVATPVLAVMAPPAESAKQKASTASAITSSTATKKRADEVSIKDIIALFIPKIWIILICAVVLGILLGGYAMFFKTDTYTSKATFIVSTSTTVSESDLKLSDKIINILDVRISTKDFLEVIADEVNTAHATAKWEVTDQELGRAITLTKLNEDTPAFTLTITTTNAQKSQAIAETLVEYLVEPEDGSPAKIEKLLPESFKKVSIKKLESPKLGSVNDKGVLTNALVGFLVGAVVSMVVIYMIAMFDVVIHDRKKLEDHFDFPILGVIPRFESFPDEYAKGGR